MGLLRGASRRSRLEMAARYPYRRTARAGALSRCRSRPPASRTRRVAPPGGGVSAASRMDLRINPPLARSTALTPPPACSSSEYERPDERPTRTLLSMAVGYGGVAPQILRGALPPKMAPILLAIFAPRSTASSSAAIDCSASGAAWS